MLLSGPMNRRHLVAAVLVVAAGCGRSEPAAPQASAASPSPTPPPPVICPLTGTETSQEFQVDRPALAVKVENSPASRPQAGLEAADIVYEELAEGGITRFMAIYHCSDSRSIGPVRSARSVDPEILREYEPVLFGYSGANSAVLAKVASTRGVVDLKHGNHGEAYERVKGRKSPHNLFTSTGSLRELSDVMGAPQTGLVFTTAETEASSGVTGTAVDFTFTNGALVRYEYQPSSLVYFRFHGNTAHIGNNGRQISATNVVILMVSVTEGTTSDSVGNISPEIEVVGSGAATVLWGGRAWKGRWERKGLSDHTRLYGSSGEVLALRPGNTWIHLVPAGRKITTSP